MQTNTGVDQVAAHLPQAVRPPLHEENRGAQGRVLQQIHHQGTLLVNTSLVVSPGIYRRRLCSEIWVVTVYMVRLGRWVVKFLAD